MRMDRHAQESSTAENGTNIYREHLPASHASGIHFGQRSRHHSHYLTGTVPCTTNKPILFPSTFLFLKIQSKGFITLVRVQEAILKVMLGHGVIITTCAPSPITAVTICAVAGHQEAKFDIVG